MGIVEFLFLVAMGFGVGYNVGYDEGDYQGFFDGLHEGLNSCEEPANGNGN